MKLIKKVMVFVVVMALCMYGAGFASADENDTYSVTYNLTGLTASSQETTVNQGSSMSITLTPQDGYTLPDSVTVTMNGATLTDGYTYENGVLTIDEVYGNTVITAKGKGGSSGESTYKVSYDFYGVTASKGESNVKAGTSFSVKLTANDGYKLKSSKVSVAVDGKKVSGGYSYDSGVLTIDSVSGDTTIIAIADKSGSSDSKSKKKKTTAKKTTNKKKSTGNKSKSGSGTSGTKSGSSKSVQALKRSGKAPVNYHTGSYKAPKTGQDFDTRYAGAAGIVSIGVGLVLLKRRKIV